MSAQSTKVIPVITIDGPAGVGKGTIARLLARHLSFHWLDSGSIYRGLALAAIDAGVDPGDQAALAALAASFEWQTIISDSGDTLYLLSGRDVSSQIRTEQCSTNASVIAALPRVREQLLVRQRGFRRLPGLVAEGRDMGTAIFPDAKIKFFLTASVEIRANRRYKQLQVTDNNASITEVMNDMLARDERDASRTSSPLAPASDAITIDTGLMTVDDTVDLVLTTVDTKL